MKEITEHEERVMRIFWSKGEALIRDILKELPEPAPPYTTVASTVRLLESKGYLRHKTYGNTHLYFPVISQEAYSRGKIRHMVSNFFEGSARDFLSFMVREKEISKDEIDALQREIDEAEKRSKK